MKLTQDLTDELTTSRIVSSSFESSRRWATLAAGRGDGVQIGYPVRAPEGLVGRIVETGQFALRVFLLTVGACNAPVQLATDGTPAMATGGGDGTIEGTPLALGENTLKWGVILPH